MVLQKIPVKPNVRQKRSNKINKYFQSKKRYNAQGFIELLVTIKLVNAPRLTDYGYSSEFNVNNPAEYRSAIEDAFYNALAKVAYREGYLFDGSDDIQEVDSDLVEYTEIIDYTIYYLTFKGEEVVNVGGDEYRLRRDGEFVGGFGRPISDKSVREVFKDREESFAESREESRRKSRKIQAAKRFR